MDRRQLSWHRPTLLQGIGCMLNNISNLLITSTMQYYVLAKAESTALFKLFLWLNGLHCHQLFLLMCNAT